jgi:hypothetical protein
MPLRQAIYRVPGTGNLCRGPSLLHLGTGGLAVKSPYNALLVRCKILPKLQPDAMQAIMLLHAVFSFGKGFLNSKKY